MLIYLKKDPDEEKYAILFEAPSKIERDSNDNISMVPTSEEIWSIFKRMKSLKSPGPDGMPPFFFKKCCKLIGEDVSSTIKDCFITASIPLGLNHTNIVLIPKVKKSSHTL